MSLPSSLVTDVVVLGSGAAGLTAALSAAATGAEVVLLEKAGTLGGATAVSGGVLWVPGNHAMEAAGLADSRADAVRYITRLADGRGDASLIETFVEKAPEVTRFVEEQTPLRFGLLPQYADYYPRLPGGKEGGRSLDPGLFDTRTLGDWQGSLRRSPVFAGFTMSVAEFFEWRAWVSPAEVPFEKVMGRATEGFVSYGGALAGGLLHGVVEQGVEIRLGTAVRELLTEKGRVVGVVAFDSDHRRLEVEARRGVVLASGGFEWDDDLRRSFLGGVLTHPLSPPSNEGDGLRMLQQVGASLGSMSEAWWCPAVQVPGELYDGAPLARGEFTMRALPHSLIVNRQGRRFVNEAHNYNDLMKACFTFDPRAYERSNLPAWLIFDSTYTGKYPVFASMPGMPLPDWIPSGDSLAALAAKLGVDANGLEETVERFNRHAAEGQDPDFGRGASAYDGVYGDSEMEPNANLGSLEEGPFYALEIHPGALGTKGGARVDAGARVLRPSGEIISGLYAAGNAMAGFTGAGYPGAGATLAAAMTFGYLAGRHAAEG